MGCPSLAGAEPVGAHAPLKGRVLLRLQGGQRHTFLPQGAEGGSGSLKGSSPSPWPWVLASGRALGPLRAGAPGPSPTPAWVPGKQAGPGGGDHRG